MRGNVLVKTFKKKIFDKLVIFSIQKSAFIYF